MAIIVVFFSFLSLSVSHPPFLCHFVPSIDSVDLRMRLENGESLKLAKGRRESCQHGAAFIDSFVRVLFIYDFQDNIERFILRE